MSRPSLFLSVITLVGLASAPIGQAYGDAVDCVIATDAIQQASTIRKLSIRSEVPCLIHQKDEVKKFLVSSISEKLPPDRLENEGLLYRAIGIIPESFDYKQGILDLYLEQLGGYYDPDAKHFVMAGWLPPAFQTSIAVHELTHALQDQYYNLTTFIDQKNHTSDELLARSALVEGDATAVMLDYARHLGRMGPIRHEQNVDAVIFQNVLGSGIFKQGGGVPQSLYAMLIFPYTSGLRFVHSVLQESDYEGLERVFLNPPRSTEEILHPEKYRAKQPDFTIPSIESLTKSGERVIFSDVVGEFGVSASLMLWLKDKKELREVSAGWGGDRIALLQDGATGTRRILWWSLWDTESDAVDFYKAFQGSLEQRFGLMLKDGMGEFSAPTESIFAKPSLTRNGQMVHYQVELK